MNGFPPFPQCPAVRALAYVDHSADNSDVFMIVAETCVQIRHRHSSGYCLTSFTLRLRARPRSASLCAISATGAASEQQSGQQQRIPSHEVFLAGMSDA